MGGCYKENNDKQVYFAEFIDNGEGLGNLELNRDFDSNYYSKFALKRVLKHKNNIIKANPYERDLFEESLKSTLTHLITGELHVPDYVAGKSIKYLKNWISVPRDMPVISARLLRQ